MKDLENLPENIFDLLAQKKYAALSASEKKQVDEYMSEEEFDSYRMIVQDFQDLDANFSLEKPKLKTENKSVFKKILNYPIPLYQVAATFLLFTLATFALPNLNKNTENEQVVTNPKTEKTVGKSLAKDDYPDDLVFNF